MESGAEEISAGSNSSGMHSLQCSSQQQVNMHQQQKEEIQQQGEQQHQQLLKEWQQQLEDHSDHQEQFELGQTQHPEQSQLQPYVQSEHRHLEPPQLQQKQHWQPEQQQQLQQVQMQQMLQHSQQQHLQEMHSQQQKLQQPQHQQELVPQLQQQLQPQQQESPLQSEQQDMAMQLQQQELPLQELALQLQQQELALQLQQQQLQPQMPHEHLKQLPQTQQQQLEQSPAEPQQQHLQQPQQQQHSSQHFPLQTQQYVPQSQQQPQQSSLEPQHQLMQPLSEHQLQQLPLHSQQQHLPQPQQQTQQQQLHLLSQHHQQSQQLPLQSQEQHLPQSQQKPPQQVQQSPLPSQHQHLQQLPQPQQQPQLQQAPLPSQQQHLQQLAQSQQQPQQKLQQLSLQQQQQHLQQSQQQAQQHLQQSSMSSHQQTQQQLPQPQQQRSQQLPHSQQQLQQPQPQQQRSQLQPHLQQLSQSQQQLQQKQLQPQVQQQQQQQQLSNQQPSQPAVGQATTSVRGQNASGSHSISFGSLIPMILPHLSKEQSDRLQGLYTRLRRNEVTKEDFLRATRNVVGDQMLVQAVRQMQQKHQGQSQPAPSSQASQLQQQQRQQQHAQGSSQQFMPQQSIHTKQLNEPQPFQQVSPANLQSQTQRTSDYQPHPHSSAPASLTASHLSSDNKTQQSRQSGEQRPEISSVHGNQTSTMNLHQVKHEVDRTMIGFPLPNQQQQQHLQVPPSSFPMYGRPPGNYSSQSFSASPGIPPSGVKALAQDSQTKQVMHPQVGIQAQGGPPQLSNIKNMPKYDLSKQAKRREDDERQKILQSSGASHFSGQHQPSVWATSLDKEKAVNTGISPSSSVHIKQEINENSDQQHSLQTLQPMKDKSVPIDHGQSLILTKTESVEHQSIKTSGISSGNHPLGSTGLHSDHLMQPPLATSAATLHHTLSGFSGPVQMRPQVPSTPPSSMVGSQIKTPPKKMLIGQKKPFEVTGTSMQLASKKQKVSAGYLDQSIDQLNDVTAVSGVNLREEEEQLFAGPKEESRATEAMRKVVQEEEERTFLQKGSLRAKLVGIMAKYGIKYINSDSERCLSLCVEERLRTMIGHLIRLSKQRVDLEKVSHKVTITSDVRRQILAMNKKAKDDLEKKQAEEAEKLRKLNEIENVGPEGEKDETRTKAQKAQKEEDDKMRANAANVAARAAVGGDDMLSKWQLMAEQARQKREGTSDGASNTRTNRDANRKSVVGGLKSTNVSDHQDAPSTGIVRNLGRTSGSLSQTKPVRSICIKDVIALLEREPQMTKSTLLYRLYERGVDCSKEKGTEIQNSENTLQ